MEPAHAEALAVVQVAGVKHVDETSWKQGGKKCWLWVAALATLLGNRIHGILCSERWSVYHRWPVIWRQVCWRTSNATFKSAWTEAGGARSLGQGGLAIVKEIFAAWHRFRGGGLSRAELQKRLDPVARRLRKLLDAACSSPTARRQTSAPT